jgi:hypothetical protein
MGGSLGEIEPPPRCRPHRAHSRVVSFCASRVLRRFHISHIGRLPQCLGGEDRVWTLVWGLVCEAFF